VHLRPCENEPKLSPRQVAVEHFQLSIWTFAPRPAARTWKCGGPWSSKYIVIVIPKKRLIVGM
jgi:hypothetical protein